MDRVHHVFLLLALFARVVRQQLLLHWLSSVEKVIQYTYKTAFQPARHHGENTFSIVPH